MESCPDCGFELKLCRSDYRGELMKLTYYCYKCNAYKVRRITYKPQSGLVESDEFKQTA